MMSSLCHFPPLLDLNIFLLSDTKICIFCFPLMLLKRKSVAGVIRGSFFVRLLKKCSMESPGPHLLLSAPAGMSDCIQMKGRGTGWQRGLGLVLLTTECFCLSPQNSHVSPSHWWRS